MTTQTSYTQQTRTPSDLKWLLNERAAIAGQMRKTAIREVALTAKLLALDKQRARLQKNVQSASATKNDCQGRLDAFDATIALAYQQVRPDAAGVVSPHDKYGHRGALTQFVRQVLGDACPASASTRALIDRVQANFGLRLLSPAERQSLRNSVKSSLYILRRQGLVEQGPSMGPGIPGIWKWKQPTTLAALAAKAKDIARATADDKATSPAAKR